MEFTNTAPERRFATQEEADDECDALNADEGLGQSWQSAFVNDGDEDYWVVTLEAVECDDPGPNCEIHEGACD